jgi:choline dehydrogenase-like flavoprotein
MHVVRPPKTYDVCTIGSGAAGGTAAKVLTEGGLEVVMLEAGTLLDPNKDFKEHTWPYELTHRGAGIAGMYYNIPYLSEFTAPNAFFTIKGEPYTIATDSKFMWLRSRLVCSRCL